MVKDEFRRLPNNILIHIIWKRLYAWVLVDTYGSAYDFKDPSKVLIIGNPYGHKKYRAHAGKTSATFINIKKEHAEELAQKLAEFLTNPDNLEEIPSIEDQLREASKEQDR